MYENLETKRFFGILAMKVKIVLFLLIISAVCPAQETNNFFSEGFVKAAQFGKPFWADMHSPLNRVEISYATNSPDYDYSSLNTNYRPYIFANLGADVPIWSGNFTNGKYGLSVTLPFFVDIWLDRFDDTENSTAALINTSYRFGIGDTVFIYRLNSPLQILPHFNIYNWNIKISFYKHESTHLGDELAILRKDQGLPITRIDVASNYGELIFTLNDPDGKRRLNHGFRFGFLFLYDQKRGWYKIYETEAQLDLVERSRFPFEIYFQYQFESALFSRNFQIIGSVEYRLREQYKYPYSYSGGSNEYLNDNQNVVNCFNIFAGIRFDNLSSDYFSKIGLGFRFYTGINPYGQFRSMPNYMQLGVALFFE